MTPQKTIYVLDDRKATDVQAETGTNTTKYITPKQAKDNYKLVRYSQSDTVVKSISGSRTSTSTGSKL